MGAARPRREAVAFPKRGETYLADFDPVIGSEIAKTRPGLVIQNDMGNRVSPITIVAALSSQVRQPLYPIEVLIHAPEGGLTTDSTVRLNQLRTMDKSRLIKRLGKVSAITMAVVDTAIKISLRLIEV
ncbi:MAG: type II toxin-antitoxin system PemK/MazF family toxin [Candidatus Binatia bacterium]